MLKSFFSLPIATSAPFTLQDLEGFPYTEWQTQNAEYERLQGWYDGVPLDEELIDKNTGAATPKYPLHLNPIPNTCEKHASVLLGNNLDSIRDGGIPVTFAFPSEVPEEKARQINNLIRQSLFTNGGGAMIANNAIQSQYLGGCIFGVAYTPMDSGDEIKTFKIKPSEFIGYPDGVNEWSLSDAWFVREISASEASTKYDYPVSDPTDLTQHYYYNEHWTKTTYEIRINNTVIRIDGIPLTGDNPYKRVPYVYIPRIRTKNYLGDSMVTKAIEGLIFEINLRSADTGDAVNDDSHSVLAGRGLRSGIKTLSMPDGRIVYDLGVASGLGAHDTQPDLFAVRTQSASDTMLKYSDDLEEKYRREARHPAVADGEDEGSQRSSLTLTTRMFPLVSHIKLQRLNWTIGFINLIKIILTIASVKGLYDISMDDIRIHPIIKWPPMLPRDREEIVNETAIRRKNGLGSREHLLGLFQDVDDISAELARIEKDLDDDAKRMAASKPQVDGSDPTASKNSDQAQNQNKKEE